MSASGDTVVVGAPQESSNATGVNGDENDDSAGTAGAAYTFIPSTLGRKRRLVTETPVVVGPVIASSLESTDGGRPRVDLDISSDLRGDSPALRAFGPLDSVGVLLIGTRVIDDGERRLVGSAIARRALSFIGPEVWVDLHHHLRLGAYSTPLYVQVGVFDPAQPRGVALSPVVDLAALLDAARGSER